MRNRQRLAGADVLPELLHGSHLGRAPWKPIERSKEDVVVPVRRAEAALVCEQGCERARCIEAADLIFQGLPFLWTDAFAPRPAAVIVCMIRLRKKIEVRRVARVRERVRTDAILADFGVAVQVSPVKTI